MERDRLRGETVLGSVATVLVGMVSHDWFNPLSVFVAGRWSQMLVGKKLATGHRILDVLFGLTLLGSASDAVDVAFEKYALHVPDLLQGGTDNMLRVAAYSAATTAALLTGKWAGPIVPGRITEASGRWTKGVWDAARGR